MVASDVFKKKQIEALREKIFNIVTDPPCHYLERTMAGCQQHCEFWDVEGHYCWLKNMHPDSTHCDLMNQIEVAIKEAGMVWLDEECQEREKQCREKIAESIEKQLAPEDTFFIAGRKWITKLKEVEK